MRIKAILSALYHGIMPYWVYEKQKHYECSYLRHLWINIQYAFRWATFRELESDREFEKDANIGSINNFLPTAFGYALAVDIVIVLVVVGVVELI